MDTAERRVYGRRGRAACDEGVSAESALKLLEQERLSVKAKDGRNAKGRIDVLLERREECIREKYALETQLAQTEATERRTDAIRKELSSVAEKLDSAEEERKRSIAAERSAALRDRLRRAEDCERRLAEIRGSDGYIRSRGLTDAEVTRTRELEDEIRRLGESEPSGDDYRDAAAAEARLAGSRKTVIGGAALAAAGAVGAIICLIAGSLKVIAFAILLLVGLIFLFLGIRTAEACKNIIKTYRLEKQKRDAAENEKRQRAETLTAELGEITKRFGSGSSSELAELYAAGLGLSERERSIAETLKECLGGCTLDELRESAGVDIPDGLRSSEELNEIIGGLQRRQNELTAEISALESKLAYDTKITRIPADIDTELASIGEEIAECERRLKIIKMAEDGIKEAADIWKSSVTPQINERVNEIVSSLTGGRYDAVRVANDYRMRVEASGGLYNAEYLSCGTYEQLYLALRVAVAELICGGGLLFLDDALVAYDDERTAAAVGFLSEYAENRQIFLFTCHSAAGKTAKCAKIIELQI